MREARIGVFALTLELARDAAATHFGHISKSHLHLMSPRSVRAGAARGYTLDRLAIYGRIDDVSAWLADDELKRTLLPCLAGKDAIIEIHMGGR